MNDLIKKTIYEKAINHSRRAISDILAEKLRIKSRIKDLRERLQKGNLEDPDVVVTLVIHQLEHEKQLSYSENVPYFVRCDVKFDDSSKTETLFFGRFAFREDSIFSWVAPASSIRFESPGEISYILPNGKKRMGTLLRKDQYMIIDREIFFLSSEATNYERELIYQKHFTERKVGFILPEIVEQMEKAQDTIIRSHYFGSFLISGAAGSGKTTLALHRVAYLVQSPETEKTFNPSKITVFVQDASTKKYFSGLLPELGIYRVNITTFDEWAMKILGITTMEFVKRYGKTEMEKDIYEHSKNLALQSLNIVMSGTQIERILKTVYGNFMSYDQKQLLHQQLQDGILDRFDLTILLRIKLLQEKMLLETVEKFKKQKSTGKYTKTITKQPINYSLIVIDEAENYLKEQIGLIKGCIDPTTNAVIYVGDLVQRTMLWTLKDWKDVNEKFQEERKVVLQKVYRNTKQILKYIQNNGFKVEIPENIKNGEDVIEKTFRNKLEEIKFVKEILKENAKNTIGILAKTEEYLEEYKKQFSMNEKLFIMIINEAQGVEFDTVILVGMNDKLFKNHDQNVELIKERRKVNRDLIYVALTRAMNYLYVCGNKKLQNLLSV